MIQPLARGVEKQCAIVHKGMFHNPLASSIVVIVLVTLITFVLSQASADGFMLMSTIVFPLLTAFILYNVFTAHRNYTRALRWVFIISLIAQSYLAIQFIGLEYDLNVQYNAGEALDQGLDTYEVVTPYYAEPIHAKLTTLYDPDLAINNREIDFYAHPSRIYLSFIFFKLSQATGIFFSTLMNFPMIIASLLIGYLMMLVLQLTQHSAQQTYGAVALYLLNPVTILISGYHGQVDNLGIIFLVWFVYLSLKSQRVSFGKDLIFGLSLLVKPVTAAVVPYLVMQRKTMTKKALFLIAAALPYLAVLITYPFLQLDNAVKFVISYGGVRYLWSYSRIENYLTTTFNLPELHALLANVYSFITIAIFLFLFYYFYQHRKIGYLDGILLSYLFFFSTHSGFGIQYLMWIMPFLALKAVENQRFASLVYVFSFISLVFAVTFYYGAANNFLFIRDALGYSIFGILLWLYIVFMTIWYFRYGISPRIINKATSKTAS